MNICFVNTTDLIGGAERCSFDLMCGLRSYGHRVSLVVGRKLSEDPDVYPCHYPVWDWRPRALLHGILGLTDTTLTTPLRMVHNHPAFRQADVVNVHNMHGDYWNFWTLPQLARRGPVVLTLHDEWFLTGDCVYTYDCQRWRKRCGRCPQFAWPMRPDLGGRDLTTLNVLLKRAAARACRPERMVIVTPSDWLAARVRQSRHLSRFRVETIPNGIDPAVFQPSDNMQAKARFGLPADRFCFLFFANNLSDPRKGFDLLEKTLQRYGLPGGSVLLLVGNGAGGIAAEFPSLPVYGCSYLGTKVEVAQCLSAADCMLLLSKADNLPYTGVEALACGCGILARDAGGIREIVENGSTGYLLPAVVSEEQLAFKMAEVAALPRAKRAEIAAHSRATAIRRFSMQAFLGRYEALFESLIPQQVAGMAGVK